MYKILDENFGKKEISDDHRIKFVKILRISDKHRIKIDPAEKDIPYIPENSDIVAPSTGGRKSKKLVLMIISFFECLRILLINAQYQSEGQEGIGYEEFI